MPIATNDQFIASLKPRLRVIKNLTAARSAGAMVSPWLAPGLPVAGVLPAANTGTVYDRTSQGAIGPITAPGGSNVFYLGGLRFRSSVAGDVDIYDRLITTTVPNVTLTTAQTMPAAALPRYTTGDGVEMFMEVFTTMGAGTPTLTISYTNQAGTAGRTATLVVPTSAMTAGQVVPIPLQSGDTGVQTIQTITLSATMTSGNFGITLGRYLGGAGCPLANVSTDPQDYAELGLPNITTSPCLWPLFIASSTTATTIYGHALINEFAP
jgi:hypothetical protein